MGCELQAVQRHWEQRKRGTGGEGEEKGRKEERGVVGEKEGDTKRGKKGGIRGRGREV